MFVADFSQGVWALNASDPANPVVLDSIDFADRAEAMTIEGSLAYIAHGIAGLTVMDISSPSALTPIATKRISGTSGDIAFLDGLAYLASGAAGLQIVKATPCPPDTNCDGALSSADFTAWIAAFNKGSPRCDQNADTQCTPADFTAWIANYNSGC